MRVAGRALGADGSSWYATAVGDFFIYPTDRGGWLVIWEPRIHNREYAEKVSRHSKRADAIEWIECCFSFAW